MKEKIFKDKTKTVHKNFSDRGDVEFPICNHKIQSYWNHVTMASEQRVTFVKSIRQSLKNSDNTV